MADVPEIETPIRGSLVALRATEEEDLPLLKRWINDPDVTETLAGRYPYGMRGERDYYEANYAPAFKRVAFVIVALESGVPIGNCSLDTPSPEDRAAELGIFIGEKSFWDRGFGTDAMKTLVRFGFDEMNLNRIELTVFDFNHRAIRVYEKIGFEVEGTLREAHYQNGAYVDMIAMSILRRDWEAHRPKPE
jgi:RimJ/RimL family protein N-acetyltransferase